MKRFEQPEPACVTRRKLSELEQLTSPTSCISSLRIISCSKRLQFATWNWLSRWEEAAVVPCSILSTKQLREWARVCCVRGCCDHQFDEVKSKPGWQQSPICTIRKFNEIG